MRDLFLPHKELEFSYAGVLSLKTIILSGLLQLSPGDRVELKSQVLKTSGRDVPDSLASQAL